MNKRFTAIILSIAAVVVVTWVSIYYSYLYFSVTRPVLVAPVYDEGTVMTLMADEALYNRGSFHFKTRCADCHGFQFNGTVEGPGLHTTSTDFNELYDKIYYGKGAMPAWGHRLQEKDLQAMVVYLKRALAK